MVAGLYRALRADTDLLLTELRETVPLSRSRREDIEALRSLASHRFVPVP